MAITLNRWEAEIVVPTGGWDCTLTEGAGGGAQTATVAAGTYTWATFRTAFAAALTAETQNAYTYSTSITDDEGETPLLTVTTTDGTVSFTVEEVDADLFSLIGFSADMTPTGTSFTGDEHVKGMWLPDCPHLCTYQFGDEKDVSDRSTLMSPDGTNSSYLSYNRVRVLPDLRYQTVDRQRARAAGEVYANEAWSTFWKDVIDGDQSYFRTGKVRVFPDADTDATSYQYWYGDQRECAPANVREGWQKLWLITMPQLTRVET